LSVLVLLTAGLFVRGLAENANRLLVGFARQEAALRVVLPASVATVLLAVPLTARWGVAGTAAATLLGDFATLGVLYGACGVIGVRMRDYFRATLMVNVVPAAAAAVAYALLRVVQIPSTYGLMLLHATVGLGTFAVVAWRWSLTSAERQNVRRWWKSRVPHRR
jgi:O-antigen/teichoic acid export membrane protein